ncbi:MAG: hypothetical protein D6788_06610, partial [Planctomycetota bacterium]
MTRAAGLSTGSEERATVAHMPEVSVQDGTTQAFGFRRRAALLWKRMREAPYVVRRRFARPHPAPVIVLGNQKSGTTVIAALLAESAGCAVTLDIFFRFRRPVLARLLTGRDSLDRFIRRHPYWFSHPIIKEPSLTFFHDDLRRLFPSARFVFIVRDPRDNIRSILNRLRLPG